MDQNGGNVSESDAPAGDVLGVEKYTSALQESNGRERTSFSHADDAVVAWIGVAL